ncbi:transmembrane 7 superfamily member 3-like isoform X2 [Aricia agestis]|nr:transmembrane 7 superfamily member 3-like isoform X2 [Aricia agestis]
MEFPIPISPFMRTSFNKDYVLVSAALAKNPKDVSCTTIDKTTVVFYKLFLSERDFSTETYFEGIKQMMTMDGIADYGEYVPANGLHMRRMLSAYPGTGSIYVAVAFSNDYPDAYAVYVPTSSYACDPLDYRSCTNLDDVFSNMVCTSLIFIGLFMCYLGHRFFKTEMFLVGLFSGVFITFVLISIIADVNRPALLGASIISGLCFGAIWLCFWWFYGIPVFSVFLPTLNLGFLFASILYYSLPGGIAVLTDLSFWTIFIFVMLMTSLLSISTTYHTNIACCAILGAYAFIYPIDHYIGSNLKYILVNTVRRAVVPNFNKAVISPPFEWSDASLVVVWAAVAVTGFLLQRLHNRGRPPFPPPPRSVRPAPSMYGSADVLARRHYQYENAYAVPSTSQSSETAPLLSTEN